jgi:hypothetical protein
VATVFDILGPFLLVIQDKSRMSGNLIFLLCNVFTLILQPISVSGNRGPDDWLPSLGNLAEQLAIGSQVWADSLHNKDDFVGHDLGRRTSTMSVTEPLLAL